MGVQGLELLPSSCGHSSGLHSAARRVEHLDLEMEEYRILLNDENAVGLTRSQFKSFSG